MTSIFRTSQVLAKVSNINWTGAISRFGTSVALQKDTKQINADVILLTPEEREQKQKLKGYITLDVPADVSPISGIPPEQLQTRKVRIFEPAKNAMQSGTENTLHWELEFNNQQRWENPLMGWTSTGDPLSNLKLKFANKEEAVEYCERNRWQYYIDERAPEREFKPKSYAINFSWNKRTRASTK